MSVSYDDSIRYIADNLISFDYGPDHSLFNGKAGHALFYALLAEHYNEDRYFEEYARKIRDILSSLKDRSLDSTFGNGLAGVGWLFQRLSDMEMINDLDENFFLMIDRTLEDSLHEDFQQANFDLIQGAIGKGIYFLARPETSETVRVLEKITFDIIHLAQRDDHGLKWKTKDNTFNLGVAHGIASVVVFLSKINKEGILPQETYQAINQATTWLMHVKETIPVSADGSACFPVAVSDQLTSYSPSRLAWCNGDLPVALSLFRASEVMKDKVMKKQAIEIALGSTRRTLENSGVSVSDADGTPDSAFCHGTAGLIHMYRKFYEETGNDNFLKASHYWLEQTLIPHPEGQGNSVNFKTSFNYGNEIVWKFNGSVLQGATGTGLVLLSMLNQKANVFEEIFLCN